MSWIGHPDNVFITRQELYEWVWPSSRQSLSPSNWISGMGWVRWYHMGASGKKKLPTPVKGWEGYG